MHIKDNGIREFIQNYAAYAEQKATKFYGYVLKINDEKGRIACTIRF